MLAVVVLAVVSVCVVSVLVRVDDVNVDVRKPIMEGKLGLSLRVLV